MRLKADDTISHNIHNLGTWIKGTNDGFGAGGYLLRLRCAVYEFIDMKANGRTSKPDGPDARWTATRCSDLIIAHHRHAPDALSIFFRLEWVGIPLRPSLLH